MAKTWLIRRRGKTSGPFSEGDIHRGVANGKIRRTDLLKQDGDDIWQPAETLSTFFPDSKEGAAAGYPRAPTRAYPSSTIPHPFLDGLQESYQEMMRHIDVTARELVAQGKDFKAITLVNEQLAALVSLWEMLSHLYITAQQHVGLLEHFGSQRHRQLGGRLPDICRSHREYESDREYVEHVTLRRFTKTGIAIKTHPFVQSIILTEIEFMLDTLRILIEPDYVPDDMLQTSGSESSTRYIPTVVKLAVWRRDGGKCVQCGSQERLEYDHIIPVSKGGANTERNVQLLCEKCNREKAAQIS